MQSALATWVADRVAFQSSPGPKAGCNALSNEDKQGLASVSILTRPEGRVQYRSLETSHPARTVSILTRPEGRVQLKCNNTRIGFKPFQSSPGPKAGCNIKCNNTRIGFKPFQSSPGPKAGCNEDYTKEMLDWIVSILTRPEGRVQ